MNVNEMNAREEEKLRAQRTVLQCLADFNTKAADKAEILSKAGHKGVPILFMQSEVQAMLWELSKRMKS